MDISYRKPTSKELPNCLALITEAKKPYRDLPIYQQMGTHETRLQDLVDNPKSREFRVLLDNDAIVGFSAFKNVNNKITWLSQFYIDPERQRHGYGRIFLDHLEKEIADISKYLVLEYWPDAVWAKDFYIKNGYKEMPEVYESKSTYTKVLAKILSG